MMYPTIAHDETIGEVELPDDVSEAYLKTEKSYLKCERYATSFSDGRFVVLTVFIDVNFLTHMTGDSRMKVIEKFIQDRNGWFFSYARRYSAPK